jgi:hypothetical protein
MRVRNGTQIQYYLLDGADEINMNEMLGKSVHIRYTGEIHCIHCGKKTKKSFGQGYCFNCFSTVPETSDCVLRPELCKAHEGISRDMNWSESHCLQDHYVYLALTSAIKVGVTRSSQIPTRWIDQGAWQAIRIAKTPNRYLAGCIEVELKKHVTDKTNWRHMLTNLKADQVDLPATARELQSGLPTELQSYLFTDTGITELNYPVLEYPGKVNSVTLEKQTLIEGTLSGIRGQYLMFEKGLVMNIRNHQGYRVELGLS